MKVHILDDWYDTLRGLPSFGRMDGHEVTVWTDHAEDTDVLAGRLAEAECVVLFRERTPVTAELLERLPRLKLISLRGVYPHVEVSACTANGVVVSSNTAGGTSIPASELTFAFILTAARQIPRQMARLKAGGWQGPPGQTLAGRWLGLYGYGRIGQQVAKYARAFDMRVWWWASDEGRARALRAGEDVAPSRAAFFAESDFVSLHLKQTAETRGIVTAEDLTAMKPTATFVNTSRAGLVAPGALKRALEAGRPGGLALDVFEPEPFTDTSDPVLSHPSVIATPHIGFVTEEELDKQFSDIYDQINAYAEGAPVHVVNPEAI